MKLIKTISLLMIYLVVTISFALYTPEIVSAQELACCQQTNSGDFCRYTEETDCNSDFLIAKNVYCESLDFCKLGCCYDTEEGSCASGVAKSTCEARGAVWNPDPQCNIQQCQLGCCQISNQCSLATQNKCRATASQYPGVEMIFHSSILTEQDCVNECRGTEEGACVSSEGSCLRTTREECAEQFNFNMLCSHTDLQTNCAPQQTTGCSGEDVYWYDSCGNKENIYNSNKRASYNSGYIQKESESPRASPNDQDLGNCDYITGTLCGEAKGVSPTYGNYVCKDMNCYDVYENDASPNSGGNKRHGESWCVYDARVGPGNDVVGSRHRRHLCINGEEIVEECADYREEYCIQNMVGSQETGVNFLNLISEEFSGYTEALCKENRFEDCSSCTDGECCYDPNKDCYWIDYGELGADPSGLCVPLFPPGMKFWETGTTECAVASQECEVYEENRFTTDYEWECRENCQCLEHEWAVTSNRYCRSIGDCGAYYNYEGELTLGGYTLGEPIDEHYLSLTDFESWSSIQIQDFDELYNIFLEEVSDENYLNAAQQRTAAIITGGVALLATYGWVAAGWGPIGWIILAVAMVVWYFTTQDRTEDYTFTCEPWEAPDGGDDCEKCGTKDIECTEYACKSLGKDCELVNEGTSDQKCVAVERQDSVSPILTPGEMDFEISQTDLGFEITELLKPFTPVTVRLTTDEPAQCRFSTEPNQEYDEMTANFGTSLYLYDHELFIPIPSEATSEEALLATNGGRYEFYVRCRDASENKNQRDYSISFQIDAGPDQTSPSIEKTLPDNESPIPYGQEEYETTFLLNEPADCKWSTTDKDFEQMENDFTCAQTGFDMSSFYQGLYECSTTLTDIQQNQLNTYYIRCKDKANNIQQQSYVYTLVSTPPLQITSTGPEGRLFTRYPILEVTTSQGAENGRALCGFNENDVTLTNMIQMFNTNSTEHSQQIQPPGSGTYLYYISCVDRAGNVASEQIQFNLEISLEISQIYNIYRDTNLNILHISTSEDTTCEYSEQQFTFGTGLPMTQPDSKEHTANLGLSVYYIQCQDQFNNLQSAVVYP